MKRYLVELNRPVLAAASPCEQSLKQSIYGFLGPYVKTDEAENAFLEDEIYIYVGYLAAMHDWVVFNGDVEFTVTGSKNWRDRDGHIHPTYSNWAQEIGHTHMKRLGLDYTLYEIDLDGVDSVCLDCGKEMGLITCESLMNNLVRLAEEQEDDEKDERHTVILFNRPIWLPNRILLDDAEGFSHIYGMVSAKQIDEDLVKTSDLYLGYLAMCEEFTLTGQTPSGYTTEDFFYWYKDGEEYIVVSDEIKAECLLCKQKHNLKAHTKVVKISKDDLEDGVQGDHIVSKWLYESLTE